MHSRVPEMIAAGSRTVILTGAGVSAESGVPTFRGKDGLWEGGRPEDLASPEALAADPERVWRWYAWRREKIAACAPNAAHRAIAALDEALPDFLLVTQNVDGLHRLAGSRRMVELHGCLWEVRCLREGTVAEDHRVPLPSIPPRCACGALLRPHVVWFGEALDGASLARAAEASRRADLFLAVGTSGIVHPAASLPLLARENGAWFVEVNPEASALSRRANECVRGPAAEVLPALLGGGVAAP